jgi:hypothetical protein
MNKDKNQTVNWEAVRMLATEVGAREAARRLGINESTVLSRAKREDWNLPKRKGGATIKSATAITLQSTPSAALEAVHADLEEVTKTGLKQTLAKAVQALAEKEALPVENIAQFKDACLAAAKLFGWDGKAQPSVIVNADKAVIVCDEGRLAEIREQRRRLLKAEKPVPGRAADVPTAAKQQTQASVNVGAGNDTVAQNQSPSTQQDSFYRHMEAIGKGETLRTGKGNEQYNEPVVTDFMPWPEEYQ